MNVGQSLTRMTVRRCERHTHVASARPVLLGRPARTRGSPSPVSLIRAVRVYRRKWVDGIFSSESDGNLWRLWRARAEVDHLSWGEAASRPTLLFAEAPAALVM